MGQPKINIFKSFSKMASGFILEAVDYEFAKTKWKKIGI